MWEIIYKVLYILQRSSISCLTCRRWCVLACRLCTCPCAFRKAITMGAGTGKKEAAVPVEFRWRQIYDSGHPANLKLLQLHPLSMELADDIRKRRCFRDLPPPPSQVIICRGKAKYRGAGNFQPTKINDVPAPERTYFNAVGESMSFS